MAFYKPDQEFGNLGKYLSTRVGQILRWEHSCRQEEETWLVRRSCPEKLGADERQETQELQPMVMSWETSQVAELPQGDGNRLRGDVAPA